MSLPKIRPSTSRSTSRTSRRHRDRPAPLPVVTAYHGSHHPHLTGTPLQTVVSTWMTHYEAAR